MRHGARRRLVLGAAVAGWLAAGCASLGPRPGDAVLTGRLSVRVAASGDAPARAFGAGFELSGDATAGRLELSTFLGTLLAQARWSPAGAMLVTPDGETAYPDLNVLARRLLGEDLPLAALVDWLHGRPWPGADSAPLDAAAEDAPGFVQLGWRVGLARHAEGVVTASRDRPPAMTVQARLDRGAP